jgi:hypothetical protein
MATLNVTNPQLSATADKTEVEANFSDVVDWSAGNVGADNLEDGAVTIAKIASASLKTGFIPLDLQVARELATNDFQNAAANGGLLASDTTPTLAHTTAGSDQSLRCEWAASNTDKLTWSLPLPPDLDDSAAITVHFYGQVTGATDTPAIAVEAYFNVSDTDAGGNTDALGASLSEVTRTISSSDVAAHPGQLTITIAPGAHGTDAVQLRAAWLEYTRK